MDEKVDTTSSRSPPSGELVQSAYIRPCERKLHDPDVTLEEYLFYAKRTREEERSLEAPETQWGKFFSRKPKENSDLGRVNDSTKIDTSVNLADKDNRLHISDEEWTNASRALRTASAAAVFYLVRLLPAPMLKLTLPRLPLIYLARLRRLLR